MKKGIYIVYKNCHTEIFEEGNIDCRELTLRGNAAKLNDE
jgi:hypothetical protein